MSVVLGAVFGAGLLLSWWSSWDTGGTRATPRNSRRGGLESLLRRAGIERVSVAGLLSSSVVVAVLVFLLFLIPTQSPPIAACFALFALFLPLTVVRWRAGKRAAALREVWPDLVDHIRSAIRAGLSLPEALIQLAEKGPEELRPAFREFAADYRVGGRFDESLDRLKSRLADPVADRLLEALRLTRQVGGADLGKLLGTLSEFLRDSARTRNELEARQSWTINAARLAVAAPWFVLMLLASRPEAVAAYNTAAGATVLLGGLVVSIVCYRLMLRIGTLPEDGRVLQ